MNGNMSISQAMRNMLPLSKNGISPLNQKSQAGQTAEKTLQMIRKFGNQLTERAKFDTFERIETQEVDASHTLTPEERILRGLAEVESFMQDTLDEVSDGILSRQNHIGYLQSIVDGEVEVEEALKDAYTQQLTDAECEMSKYLENSAQWLNGVTKMSALRVTVLLSAYENLKNNITVEEKDLLKRTEQDSRFLDTQVCELSNEYSVLKFMKDFEFSADTLLDDIERFSKEMKEEFENLYNML